MKMSPPNSTVSRRRFVLASMALASAPWMARADDVPVKLPLLDEELDRAVRDAPLSLLFRGTTSAELITWQQAFAEKLRTLIGPHRPPQSWTSDRLASVSLADHTREEWLLKSEGTPSLPLYLLRPLSGEKDRFPVILALHGHGPLGHDPVAGVETTPSHVQAIQSSNYDYGRQLVREGYLVVIPCFTPFGRRISDAQRNGKTDACAVAFVRLMFLGQTLLGANLRDALWAIDFACQRDDALPKKVGCVGLSYGGRMAMVTTALEPRINAAVISGALNVFQERVQGSGYSCGAQVIPGLLQYGDTPEIGALIAPRHCIWEIGLRDELIDSGWAERASERIQRAYDASGQPDRLQFHRFDGGHEWSGTTARPMLAEVLKAS